MFRGGKRRVGIALLSVLPVLAHAEQLPIRIYRTADGLARDNVSSIVADKNGYVWFGTSEGLSRFDGYEFTNYGVNEGLPHAQVNALLITRDGGLWIATSRGLCRFNAESRPASGRRFYVYQPNAVRDTQSITALAEDRDGSIWCGTGGGPLRLWRLSPSRAHFDPVDVGEANEKSAVALLADGQGALWIGTQHGLYRRAPEGQVQRYTTYNGLPADSIRSLFEDRHAHLWVGTDRALCLLSPHPDPRGHAVANVYPLSRGWVDAALETSDGRLSWATASGLWELIPKGAPGEIQGFRSYGTDNGLSDLPAVLRESLEQIAEGHPVRLHMTVAGQPRPLREEVDEALLRIGQEAVANAVRHAQTGEIQVSLTYDDALLSLRIQDDGRGFDLDDARRLVGHWGLRSMQERAHRIGAQWNITTAAGRGTEIETIVPLTASK